MSRPVVRPPNAVGPELVNRRTERTKTWRTASPNQFVTLGRPGGLHSLNDAGQLVDVNPHLVVQLDGTVTVTQAPYRMRSHVAGIGFDYQSRHSGRFRMQLARIDNALLPNTLPTPAIMLTADGEPRIWQWQNVLPRLDLRLFAGKKHVCLFAWIKGSAAPRDFHWQFEIQDPAQFAGMTEVARGRDNATDKNIPQRLPFPADQSRDIETTTARRTFMRNGNLVIELRQIWTGGVFKIDETTRQRTLVNDPSVEVEFPVVMY